MPCLLCRLWHRDIHGVGGSWVEKIDIVEVICGGLSSVTVCVANSCKAVMGLGLIGETDTTDGVNCPVVECCERTGDGVLTSIPCGRLPWGTVGLSVSSLRSRTPFLIPVKSLTQAWRKFVYT